MTLHGHPEYGTVFTDAEGRFSIPVEGGATMTIAYHKDGFITVHRKVYVPWNDIAIAETIRMIAEDPISTTVTFDGNPDTVVTHRSTEVTDEFGSRSCSMVFTGDNRAYLVDEQGNEIHENNAEGLLCIKYPWPGILRTTYGDHDRCKHVYFSAFKGMYFTGDGARRDADGRIRVIGRVDDVINVSGHRMGTAEV